MLGPFRGSRATTRRVLPTFALDRAKTLWWEGLSASAPSAGNAQARLAFGKYLDVFDVTEKATVASIERAKQQKDKKSSKKK